MKAATVASKKGRRVTPSFDTKLLNHLVCPQTHATLRLDQATGRLVADDAGLSYPVIDGVAILLAEAAQPCAAD